MSSTIKYLPALLAFSIASTAAQDVDDDGIPLDPTVPMADETVDQNDDDSLLDQTVPVADEEPEVEVPEIIDDEEVTEERLFEEFAHYRRMINEGTFDEADVAAKRIVEMAIKIYGPRSSETASALNNLAIVQHSNGQYDAAIQNFTSSVEILEAVDNRLSSSLVNPLKGLGSAQLAAGRPDRANRTFTRAAHITQVNDGPHNIGQVEILESVAETFLRMGDLKAARNILDRIHILNVRFYEKDPMGLIPSLMNRATWQHRAGYYNEERSTYRRAIRIIEASGDKNDPMLIEPLRRLGESYYFVDITLSQTAQHGMVATGELYFKRAMRIAERSDDIDFKEVAKTKLALADYYTYVDSSNRARKIYKEVWDDLSTDETRNAFRDELFADPVPTRTDSLPTFAGKGSGQRAEVQTGRIVVEYSVTTRGRVRDIRTEAFPPEFTDMQRMVHREIRSRSFRPRIVDGVPVEAAGLVFEHEFTYLQDDLDAIREANREQVAEVDESE